MLDLTAYFKRINYHLEDDKLPMPTFETLRSIHKAQVLTIPFEAIALHEMTNFEEGHHRLKAGVIKLDEKSIFDKLVNQRRGGYCHENNELLALVLSQLGFNVKRLLARVVVQGAELPKGHKLLLVKVDGKKYIADVGYGGNGLLEPISLEALNVDITQGIDTFRLTKKKNFYIFQAKINNEYINQYEFSLLPFKAIDFVAISNHIASTLSNSAFVRQRICVKPIETGRLILVDNILKIRNSDGTSLYPIGSEAEFIQVLNDYFGIKLKEGSELKPLPILNENSSVKIANQLSLGFLAKSTFTDVVQGDEITKKHQNVIS